MQQVIAPSKVILFGEHSIVYPDHIAVLSAIGLNVICKASKSRRKQRDINIKFEYKGEITNISINIAIAKVNYAQATKLREDFLISNNFVELSKFMNFDWGSYYVLIGKIGTLLDLPSMDIKVKINIPIGSGMGSSAAITASIIKAIYLELDEPINNKLLFELTKGIEDFQHGRSSGADPSCVINGGTILYRHKPNGVKEFKKIKTKDGWSDNLTLLYSGKPSESSGEIISMVRDLYNKDKAKYSKIFKKINNIAKRFCENKYTDIAELINENGIILEDLGIVNKKAIEFSREIRKKGGAIKVAGAGGLSESGSGILLCKFSDNVVLDCLLKQYNYSKIVTELGVEGVN